MFYPVPEDRPHMPVSIFYEDFWDRHEQWYRDGAGSIVGTSQYYLGEVSDNGITSLIGSNDEWENGLKLADWLSQGSNDDVPCQPASYSVTGSCRIVCSTSLSCEATVTPPPPVLGSAVLTCRTTVTALAVEFVFDGGGEMRFIWEGSTEFTNFEFAQAVLQCSTTVTATGDVTTSCFEDLDGCSTPCILHAIIGDLGSCLCLAGENFPITWDGSQWIGSEPACSDNVEIVMDEFPAGNIRVRIKCDSGMGYQQAMVSTFTCSPFYWESTSTPMGLSGCCAGNVVIIIQEY